MNMKIYLSILAIVLCQFSKAQSTMEAILQSVEKNNLTLASQQQLLVARQLEYSTGITPDNPFVSADYMIGRPVSGGNQLDILATQHLDFPSVYGKKKSLASAQSVSAELELEKIRKEVLLETKLVCLELIYLRKYTIELNERVNRADSLMVRFEEKLEQDDISALDVNKIKIQLLNLRSQLRDTENKISIQSERLTTLNGGMELEVELTDFEEGADILDFETLKDSITASDAHFRSLQQNTAIYQANIELARAMRLPELEVGYHYQSVLGQTFNGGHLGVSIPLWQHKNRVQSAEAFNDYSSYEIESYTMRLYSQLRESYDQYINQKQTLQEYEEALSSINSEEILDQLLKLGDIDYITYVQELEYFHQAKNNYLLLEKEAQITRAQILKYQL